MFLKFLIRQSKNDDVARAQLAFQVLTSQTMPSICPKPVLKNQEIDNAWDRQFK